jgi:hypothetical protein
MGTWYPQKLSKKFMLDAANAAGHIKPDIMRPFGLLTTIRTKGVFGFKPAKVLFPNFAVKRSLGATNGEAINPCA